MTKKGPELWLTSLGSQGRGLASGTEARESCKLGGGRVARLCRAPSERFKKSPGAQELGLPLDRFQDKRGKRLVVSEQRRYIYD